MRFLVLCNVLILTTFTSACKPDVTVNSPDVTVPPPEVVVQIGSDDTGVLNTIEDTGAVEDTKDTIKDTGAVEDTNTLTDTGVVADTQDTNIVIDTGTNSANYDGQNIKGTSLSTVYLVDNGCRYTYPNENTYYSWNTTTNGVIQLSDTEMASIVLCGNVTLKPRTVLMKTQSDTKVYWIESGSSSNYTIIRWIENEWIAEQMIGTDWNDYVVDVPEIFFIDYIVGSPITSPTDVVVDPSILLRRDELHER